MAVVASMAIIVAVRRAGHWQLQRSSISTRTKAKSAAAAAAAAAATLCALRLWRAFAGGLLLVGEQGLASPLRTLTWQRELSWWLKKSEQWRILILGYLTTTAMAS
ncbi:hypothetical protein ABZP36_025209 [Zizania latifolia]